MAEVDGQPYALLEDLPPNVVAARAMLAEDARWSVDLIQSSAESPLQGLIGLTFARHFVRVIHEGRAMLASHERPSGWLDIAAHLGSAHPEVESRVRNALKLVDDTSKHMEGVLAGLTRTLDHHRDSLRRRARPSWIRPLATDLGVSRVNGTAVLATVPAGFLLGLDDPDVAEMHGVSIETLTFEWGGNLLWLAVALEPKMPTLGSLGLGNIRIDTSDYHADTYLRKRFGDGLSTGLGLLLLGVEAEAGVVSALGPLVCEGHAGTAFRLRVITAFHTAGALRAISEHPGTTHLVRQELLPVLTAEYTLRILSRGGVLVRHRCVHYLANDPTVEFDFARPMFGIVESVFPGQTFEQHNRDIEDFFGDVERLMLEVCPSP